MLNVHYCYVRLYHVHLSSEGAKKCQKCWALDTTPTPPAMWYRYVDEEYNDIAESSANAFFKHLSVTDPHTQFTKKGKVEFHSLTPDSY